MTVRRLVAFLLVIAPMVFACDLQYSPAALKQLRRPEGWTLPGVEEFNKLGPEDVMDLSRPDEQFVSRASRPVLLFNFPSEEFLLDGKKYKTKAEQYIGAIIETRRNGRVVAYQYSLIPATAHYDRHGKLIVDSEAGCVFQVSIVDENGDGKFTLLQNTGFDAAKAPLWMGDRGI